MTREEGTIRIEKTGSDVVIFFTGKVNIDFVQVYKDPCMNACGETQRLILDFSGADYMDSSGLGFMVTLRKTMETKGGHLVLRHVPVSVRQLLTLTRLSNSFEIQ